MLSVATVFHVNSPDKEDNYLQRISGLIEEHIFGVFVKGDLPIQLFPFIFVIC